MTNVATLARTYETQSRTPESASIEPFPDIPREAFQPVPLNPMSDSTRASLVTLQAAFERRFAPLRHMDEDVLIVSWGEIHRQHMDLCAPWDRTEPDFLVRRLRQQAEVLSPEHVLRMLFVMSHLRTSLDSQPTRYGTGRRYPMP